MIHSTLGKPWVRWQELFEGTREHCIRLRWPDIPVERLGDEAHQHDIRLEVIDSDQGAEVLPGDPSEAMNSGPGTPDFRIACALLKILYPDYRYCLQSACRLNAQVSLQVAGTARMTSREESVCQFRAAQRASIAQ